MNARPRLRLAWLMLTFACAGCLPEPPTYDACAKEESAYFTVSPGGCNGHELVTLWEQQTEVTFQGFQPGGAIDYFMAPQLTFSRDDLFWVDGRGTVLGVSKRGGDPRVLFESLTQAAAIQGFDAENGRLYLVSVASDPASMRVRTQIRGIDVGTGESRLLVDLTDLVAHAVNFYGGRYYVTVDGQLLVGSLDWDATATIDGIRTCILLNQVEGRYSAPALVFVDSYAYYLDQSPTLEQSQLVGVALESCSTATRVPMVLGTDTDATLVAEPNAVLMLLECARQTPECWLSRVGPDGELDRVTRYASQGVGSPPIVDSDDIYRIGTLAEDLGQTPRLYHWTQNASNPVAIAAPLGAVSAVALDDDFVFVAEEAYEVSDGVLGGDEASVVERLLRIRR